MLILNNSISRFLLAALFLFGAAEISFACSCGQVSAEQRFNSATAVITGEIIEINDAGFRVAVNKSWKGVTTAEIILAATKTDCDPDFKIGQKYLIYVRNTEKGLQTGRCEGAFDLTSSTNQLSNLDGKQTLALNPPDSGRSRYFYIFVIPVLLIVIAALIKLSAKIFRRKANKSVLN